MENYFYKLFAALYVSEVWYVSWKLEPKKIAYKARAVVVFDRIVDELSKENVK
jgi:hypothetical protein